MSQKITNPRIGFISFFFIITYISVLSFGQSATALNSPSNMTESHNHHDENRYIEPREDVNLPYEPHQISGTISLERLTTLPDDSNPEHLTNFHSKLLFFQNDEPMISPSNGSIWLSDGTIANTTLITDTENFANHLGFHIANEQFVYVDGSGLWSSDGVGYNLNTTFISYYVPELLPINQSLFLIFDDGFRLYDSSLWQTDTLLEDATLLQDNSYGGPHLRGLTEFNEIAFYFEYTLSGTDQDDNLRKSDGTVAGTSIVASFPTRNLREDLPMMPYKNALYFLLENKEKSRIELWRSDGTEGGTTFVFTLLENCDFASYLNFRQVNNHLFFHLLSCNGTHQLWTSQGSSDNTTLLGTFNNIAGLQGGGTGLFFNADDGVNGEELWFTDGTIAGTRLVKDINPGPSSSSPSSMYFFPGTGYLYFAADDGVNGSELWQSDGSNANTALLADINPGVGDSTSASFVYIRPNLYFSANHADFGREVWKMFLPANEELFMPLVFEKQ